MALADERLSSAKAKRWSAKARPSSAWPWPTIGKRGLGFRV